MLRKSALGMDVDTLCDGFYHVKHTPEAGRPPALFPARPSSISPPQLLTRPQKQASAPRTAFGRVVAAAAKRRLVPEPVPDQLGLTHVDDTRSLRCTGAHCTAGDAERRDALLRVVPQRDDARLR